MAEKDVSINILDVINKMDLSKEEKEDWAAKWINVKKEHLLFVYDKDNITEVRMKKPLEFVDITIEIDKNGVAKCL